jgi:uncharacterized protein YydD (DUF2326 family)
VDIKIPFLNEIMETRGDQLDEKIDSLLASLDTVNDSLVDLAAAIRESNGG